MKSGSGTGIGEGGGLESMGAYLWLGKKKAHSEVRKGAKQTSLTVGFTL
jgi:hypothetical protein